jgi:CRISPR/Cas system-associated exonuclease Cas4 (RecB family)
LTGKSIISRKFSKSKINDFKKCPRKYYFQNRTELGRSIHETTNTKAYLGNVVHKLIELFNNPAIDRETIDEHLAGMETNDEGVEFCQKNINTFFKLLEKYGLGSAAFYEQRVEDEELDFSGYIDAIYDTDSGYWVIDYKTGKFYKNSMDDYIFELYIYAILTKRCLGITPSKLGMFFTSHPRSSFVIDFDQGEYEEAFETMLDYMAQMEGTEFPRQRSKLCEYCKFVNLCDAYTDSIIKD